MDIHACQVVEVVGTSRGGRSEPLTGGPVLASEAAIQPLIDQDPFVRRKPAIHLRARILSTDKCRAIINAGLGQRIRILDEGRLVVRKSENEKAARLDERKQPLHRSVVIVN